MDNRYDHHTIHFRYLTHNIFSHITYIKLSQLANIGDTEGDSNIIVDPLAILPLPRKNIIHTGTQSKYFSILSLLQI